MSLSHPGGLQQCPRGIHPLFIRRTAYASNGRGIPIRTSAACSQMGSDGFGLSIWQPSSRIPMSIGISVLLYVSLDLDSVSTGGHSQTSCSDTRSEIRLQSPSKSFIGAPTHGSGKRHIVATYFCRKDGRARTSVHARIRVGHIPIVGTRCVCAATPRGCAIRCSVSWPLLEICNRLRIGILARHSRRVGLGLPAPRSRRASALEGEGHRKTYRTPKLGTSVI
jgi:hypothetical protein